VDSLIGPQAEPNPKLSRESFGEVHGV